MKNFLLGVVAIASVFPMYGSQVAPVKPEETLIYSKIIEYRKNGKLKQTLFYLVKEPQPGKTAKPNDVVARLYLVPKGGKNFSLETLRVNEAYRERLGYGDLLFNLMKDYLRHYGAEKLSWTAAPYDLKSGEAPVAVLPKLIGFYEKQGGKVVGVPDKSLASMELDLRPLGELKQSWLPESQDKLPKGGSEKNIEIISVSCFVPRLSLAASDDPTIKKAFASAAPFVIIDVVPSAMQRVKNYIKSKL